MLRYQTHPVTAFQQNCSRIWCEHTGQAALIDPGHGLGVSFADERTHKPFVVDSRFG